MHSLSGHAWLCRHRKSTRHDAHQPDVANTLDRKKPTRSLDEAIFHSPQAVNQSAGQLGESEILAAAEHQRSRIRTFSRPTRSLPESENASISAISAKMWQRAVNQKAERIPKWEIFASARVFEPMHAWLTAEMENGPFRVILEKPASFSPVLA
jgi:hypothetical protein